MGKQIQRYLLFPFVTAHYVVTPSSPKRKKKSNKKGNLSSRKGMGVSLLPPFSFSANSVYTWFSPMELYFPPHRREQ